MKPLGFLYDEVDEGDQEVFEILHRPKFDFTWPEGPIFPQGHVFIMEDDVRYKIISSETIQILRPDGLHSFQYMHRYLCHEDGRGGS